MTAPVEKMPYGQCPDCGEWSPVVWGKGPFVRERWMWATSMECPSCNSEAQPDGLTNLVEVTIQLVPTLRVKCPSCNMVQSVATKEYDALVAAERRLGERARDFRIGMGCDCGFFGPSTEWMVP